MELKSKAYKQVVAAPGKAYFCTDCFACFGTRGEGK
jgi:hypothetical protein